jgi:hypothetical protein
MTDATSGLLLEVDIRSYWCAGTGRAGGDDVDSLIDKDTYGLPVLRGRHIKGLLREAAERLAQWEAPGWKARTRINLLFGREAKKGQVSTSAPGCIRFGDGQLPGEIAKAVRGDKKLANEFVRRLASTRIEFETGAALDNTLRSMEAAAPLKLYARLTWDPSDRLAVKPINGEEDAEGAALEALALEWRTAIDECLPFVLAVGAHRSRGFGRAVLTKVEG